MTAPPGLCARPQQYGTPGRNRVSKAMRHRLAFALAEATGMSFRAARTVVALDEPPVRAFIDTLPITEPHRPSKVNRRGGFCRAEWEQVQHGRAEREIARYARRSA